MAAIAPIAIQDGASTPVTHTYNPIKMEPATYKRNGDTSVPPVGQEELVLSLNGGGVSSEAVNRAKLSLRIPVLETPAGGTGSGYVAPPKVAYYLQANVEFLLPNRSVGQQRKDLRKLVQSALDDAQVIALIETLEKPY